MLGMFAAFKALLETDEPYAVYDWSDDALSQEPRPTHFITIADFTPSRQNPRLSSHRGVQGHMFAVTIVAETFDEVRTTVDRVRNRVEGRRLTAEGDTSTPILNEDAANYPLTRMEDSAEPRLYSVVDIFKCSTVRTPPILA